ncbi:unnamed protein product [Candidula unifasciata]|uniref:RING-type domain-containing protein n=1 Tax=Candidula unifasciata TaxID=100452 RepID=A0A8S4A3K1_9EUPU|nr:unnamed protein product [Candidula unifasciata]
MSTTSLRSQLREHYLTCSICFNSFIRPKALPCLHTFCEGCLRDYIVSRGYESSGNFPCPVCRTDITMPASGVGGFPDNYLMTSLSDTIENSTPARPMPKPRRSLGQPNVQPENEDKSLPSYHSVADTHPDTTSEDLPVCASKSCCNDTGLDSWMAVPRFTPSAPQAGTDCKEESKSGQTEYCVVSVSSSGHLPVSSGLPATVPSQIGEAIYANVNPATPNQPLPLHSDHDQVKPGVPVYPQLFEHPQTVNMSHGPAPIGWNIDLINPPAHPGMLHPQADIDRNYKAKPFTAHDARYNQNTAHKPSRTPQILYPAVPRHTEQPNTACTENLLLKFGKQGSSVRDLLKPIGLAVSKEGNYIISDSSRENNRIFIFNSGGELKTAFNCGCKAKDVAVTKGNEILVAVHKNTSAVRHFTMAGQLKGEYGKSFTFEEPCGIGELQNGGVAITGLQSHCVYVLTDQMKLGVKFGRKGNGDGYFQHPGFLAVDSRNQIIVTDKVNGCVQIFSTDGKFRHRFGVPGSNHGHLQAPLGVCVDDNDNIIVADSGNCRVEVFSPRGLWLSSVVVGTHELGDAVKPVNVAFTPTGRVAVLLRGPYFAEVRIYTSRHKENGQKEGHVSTNSTLTKLVLN